MSGKVGTVRVFFILFSFYVVSFYSMFPENIQWEKYASLCPYNNLCTANATKHQTSDEQHLVPCCQQCSCDPDCRKYGVCCPDAPYPAQSRADVEFPCVNLATDFNDPRGMTVMGSFDIIFHIVDRCPNATVAGQYEACQTQSNLRDYVVVSDISNGRVYKNSHCAECNGVLQYAKWDILTECPDINEVGFETFEERDAFIVDHCSIIPVPPESRTSLVFRCFSVDSRKPKACRLDSGKRPDPIERDTKAACAMKMPGVNTLFSSNQNSLGQISEKEIIFKNIYCYLCAKKYKKNSDLCEPRRAYVRPVAVLRDTDITPMNLMMLLSYTSPQVSTPNAARCNTSSIWDRYSVSCLKLICPDATIPYHGECINGIFKSKGVAFIAIFNMEVERPMSMSDSKKILNTVVTSAIGNDMPCGRCGMRIGKSTNTPNLYLLYYLYTQDNCTRDLILARVAQVFKQSITITVPGFNYSTLVTLTQNTYLPEDLDIVASDENEYVCPYPKPITPYILQNCARIDIRGIPFQNEVKSNPALAWKMIDNTLCVRDYFTYMESMYKNQAASQEVIQCCYLWLVVWLLEQASSVLLAEE